MTNFKALTLVGWRDQRLRIHGGLQMRYYLRREVLGRIPELNISEVEYRSIRGARDVLLAALELEEKYAMMIGAYEVFERTAMSISLSHMVRDTWSYSSFLRNRLVLNEKLMGFLSCARLYIDRGAVDAAKCAPLCSDIEERIKRLRCQEYDSNPEYQFVEKLRNYAQHHGPPIHSTRYGSRWTDFGEDGRMEYSLDLKSRKDLLRLDSALSRSFVDQLDDEIDLRSAVCIYVERLSHVQKETRGIISSQVEEARRVIEGALTMYANVNTDSLVGLCAYCHDGERVAEKVAILLDWDDIRIELQRENPELVNLRKRHISTSDSEHRKTRRRNRA